MSTVVARSIFNTTVVKPSWNTKITSAVIHVLVIGAAFLITVPVAKDIEGSRSEHVILVSPFVPRPHQVIEAPHIRRAAKVVLLVPEPILKPPAPSPIIAKVITPRVVTAPKAPVIPLVVPKPEPKIEAELRPAPAPKPTVKTGSFGDVQAKATPAPKQVVVGGFGDPRGVQAAEIAKPQPVLMARVGSFENAPGAGQAGGGRLDNGAVKQSGFGSVSSGSGSKSSTGSANLVKTGNFGDSSSGAAHTQNRTVQSTGFGDTIAAAPQPKIVATSVPAFTPVEILFKPRPSYSAEAKGMRLEGQVSLEVVFQASGAVKVVRVIKGLGHGLDEAAQEAALRVRFKPATKAGAPVDTNATISITFELT